MYACFILCSYSTAASVYAFANVKTSLIELHVNYYINRYIDCNHCKYNDTFLREIELLGRVC